MTLQLKKQKVLSVDWDYFFPDLAWMDWGHNESALMIDHIWSLRCGDVHLKTRQSALDYVQPDLDRVIEFWDRCVAYQPDRNGRDPNWPNTTVVVAESHMALGQYLMENGIIAESLDNYDQHHDMGYEEPIGANGSLSMADCGNWANMAQQNGNIVHYRLHYPPWRKTAPERSRKELKTRLGFLGTYDHDLPRTPEHYDLIFICRSGAWTPPWCDRHFSDFVQHLLWVFSPYMDPLIEVDRLSNRHPTFPEALQRRTELLRQRAALVRKQAADQGSLGDQAIGSRKK